eukprot:TRINITY_DN13342_c0_g1_i1.p1 TRINITY_DN13342_c0_g1~~TRINITY_DN13342_c0_g1_i1.p1  ORF type:complete len:130 (+),score=8.94 TRINITY_DN13342_c0_g1_i1:1249-1638(+)
MFRGILLGFLVERTSRIRFSIIWTNLLFGAFHLQNIFVGTHSGFYVLMQIILGVVVGSFYSYQILVTGNLLESVILHIANNLISSFLSTHQAILDEPLLLFSFCHTVIIYLVLIWYLDKLWYRQQEKKA